MFRSLPEPAVSRRTLILGAGIFWLIGASVLWYRAFLMLGSVPSYGIWLFAGGLILGIAKYFLILNPLVHRNVARIYELSPHKSKICLFAFQSLRSYFLVLVMVFLGLFLRFVGVTVYVLVVVYAAIGIALLLGAVTYFRIH